MSRFHVHIHVRDLNSSVEFYSGLFGRRPDVLKADYAKWLTDEPALNLSLTESASEHGIGHLGIQFEADDELEGFRKRVEDAELSHLDQEGANCCYARSDKTWIEDPDGVRWEAFRTHETIGEFGQDSVADMAEHGTVRRSEQSRCCG